MLLSMLQPLIPSDFTRMRPAPIFLSSSLRTHLLPYGTRGLRSSSSPVSSRARPTGSRPLWMTTQPMTSSSRQAMLLPERPQHLMLSLRLQAPVRAMFSLPRTSPNFSGSAIWPDRLQVMSISLATRTAALSHPIRDLLSERAIPTPR